MTKKLESSIPGLAYPSGRDHPYKTSFGYLEGRRKDDGAEGLWRIHDGLYDLKTFVNNHPGGAEWLTMTEGTDITEAFECHHITLRAEKMLPKFFVREAVSPRSVPFTFEPDGFYRKFKERAREALLKSGVDFHHPSPNTIRWADFMATMTILTAIVSAMTQSWIVMTICALVLAWTTVMAHNFLHMRDNFRRFYLDLSMMSSKDWRVSHALSHHMYPNTIWDIEVYGLEPIYRYLPEPDKGLLYCFLSVLTTPVGWSAAFFMQGIKRYYSLINEWKSFDFRDVLPLVLPLVMCCFAPTYGVAIKTWACIMLLSSLMFNALALNGAHHHPDIFHDGDVYRTDMDWGLVQMDTLRDRKIIDDTLFLVLTNFGLHAMHHLLPILDHDNLKYCYPAFAETCREFGIDSESYTIWELIKGQYRQLVRSNQRTNYRGGIDGGPMKDED